MYFHTGVVICAWAVTLDELERARKQLHPLPPASDERFVAAMRALSTASQQEQPEQQKTNYGWNVILLSAGFFGIALGWSTTQALETTLVSDKALADVSLSVLNVAFAVISVPAPKIVHLIGPKYVSSLS